MTILLIQKSVISYQSQRHGHCLKVYLLKFGKKKQCNQKYVIGNIYELPLYSTDDLNLLTNEFTDLLDVLRARSKTVFLCGDYNINVLKINTNDHFNIFYENVISSSFIPNITLPNRMCDTTSTLIDNIYTDAVDKDHTSGILIRPISDHQMYFSVINLSYTK